MERTEVWSTGASTARPRVLLVDDEANQRTTVSIGLRLEGFDVIAAHDGAEALRCLEREHVDVAIVDLMMPGMNGLELAHRLRLEHPSVKVVLSSAYHLSERQIERSGLGVIGFAPKPYEVEELAQFLKLKLE